MILFGIAKTTVSLKVRSLNEIRDFLSYVIARMTAPPVLTKIKENYNFSIIKVQDYFHVH